MRLCMDVKLLAIEQRLELRVRVDGPLFQALMPHALLMQIPSWRKPTNVRSLWLMAFQTDWFVCDGVHDGQNVSLHQSIRASGVTAHFHYEEEVNLTFHLQCVMRVIRRRGTEIKETLRSCPRCAVALPGNRTQHRWYQEMGCATRVQQQMRARWKNIRIAFCKSAKPWLLFAQLHAGHCRKSEVSAAGVNNSRARRFHRPIRSILGFKSFSKGT